MQYWHHSHIQHVNIANVILPIDPTVHSMLHVEAQLQDFLENQYAGVEEVILNNSRVLYKRKKFFLKDVRHMVKTLGYILIILVYLKDRSFLRLMIRLPIQYTLSNPYPIPDLLMLTQTIKDHSSKVLIQLVIFTNVCFIILHLIFGVYSVDATEDGYLHGQLLFQFIGERPPVNRFVLLVYDLGIFALQLVYHCLQCGLDDSEVLATKSPELDANADGLDRSQLEGDGYTGNVDLVTLDIVSSMVSSLGLKETVTFGNMMEASLNVRMRGLVPENESTTTQQTETEPRINHPRHNLPSGGFFV